MLRRVIAHEMFMGPPYYLLAELGNPSKAGRRLVIEITADNKVSCLTKLADTLDPRAGRTAREKDLEAVSVIVASRATSRGKVERYEMNLVSNSLKGCHAARLYASARVLGWTCHMPIPQLPHPSQQAYVILSAVKNLLLRFIRPTNKQHHKEVMASTTDVSSGTAFAEEDRVYDTFNAWSSALLTASDQMPRCRLLELPEELQLKIYELVVVSTKKLRLNRFCCPGHGDDTEIGSYKLRDIEVQRRLERCQPAITKTCRSIRRIALPTYYKRNFFEVCCCADKPYGVPYSVRAVVPWLTNIGASDRVLFSNFNVHERVRTALESIAERTSMLPEGMEGVEAQWILLAPFQKQRLDLRLYRRHQLSFTQ
ncbi:hypothetical protein LTR56_000545 [Elasticomyces elasticus]|nr:hypothetical protein LTR56_000545 [Elasticomyces elasticus]KAK3664321.1 hypothetical protein LTR22_004734 [Elasticomyces elasticus]KAK4915431.1 hypothetical protein LTR49_016419 [Elasticomyces elasticus]KAK5752814.1 hypothetical protein LTS12_017093 [Elasticomyces elasticus]